MTARPLSLLLLLPAALAAETPLTLDPVLYEEALREVQGLAPVNPARPADKAESKAAAGKAETAAPAESSGDQSPAAEPSADASDWQAVMMDAGTELADVRLLALLQRLNPDEPLSLRAEAYADALREHHLALAGNARACRALALAFRSGRLESGLLFIRSEALALVLDARAAAFQLPVVSPVVSPAVAPSAAASEERAEDRNTDPAP